MKRILKILTIRFGTLFLTLFIYERYFLTKWYNFEIDNIEIEVMSDECETCFMDWPIDHTIWIKSNDGLKGKFDLYTEGPRLEFGLNNDNSVFLVNCPGFSNLFIDLKKMEEIDVPNELESTKLQNFSIKWIVKKSKELIKLDSSRLPDKNWEEK